MKKIAGIVLLSLLLSTAAVTAQEQQTAETQEQPAAETQENSKWGPLSYRNVTVYKVLEHQDGYIIYYSRTGNGIAKVKIPKEWYYKKLTFRNMPPQLNPMMTVVTKDGEFHSVILTLPPSRQHHVWGVCPRGTDFSDVQGIESITLEY